MFAFELSKVTATLENFNPRKEKHGDERVCAMTLKVSASLSPDILAHFCPDLRARLFTEKTDLAGDVLAVRDPNEVFPMKRDEEMTGATVFIGYGIGEPMKFTDCKVSDFSLTPQEPGFVVTKFNVSAVKHEEHVQNLYRLQEEGITISVEPPELKEMKKAA